MFEEKNIFNFKIRKNYLAVELGAVILLIIPEVITTLNRPQNELLHALN